jgi:hypothetical protein
MPSAEHLQSADDFFETMPENDPEQFTGLYYTALRPWELIWRCRTIVQRKSSRSPSDRFSDKDSSGYAIWSLDCLFNQLINSIFTESNIVTISDAYYLSMIRIELIHR